MTLTTLTIFFIVVAFILKYIIKYGFWFLLVKQIKGSKKVDFINSLDVMKDTFNFGGEEHDA